jgi:hypothetical protein
LESIALVVLTHQLAQAFTRVGQDINGNAWDTSAFAESPDDHVEDLAQHYAEQVCEYFE